MAITYSHISRERFYSNFLRQLCQAEQGPWWGTGHVVVQSDLLRCVNRVYAKMRNQKTEEERFFTFETDDYGMAEMMTNTDEVIAKFKMEFSE